MISIGIDTGGTCTDAVIYNTKTRKILASGKTLTTKPDLETGIARVLNSLPDELIRQAQSLSLSTTLATNACVENKGCRAKLLIIGTAPEIIGRLKEVLSDYGIREMSQLIVLDARTEHIYSEPCDPDWNDLERRIPELFSDCDAVGIVQTFPNANGGRFELTALRILQKHLTIPLTIAYDISRETDFLKICASTLLNARLIPLIVEFMQAVHHVMEDLDLKIPLLIVRSDGTLMSEEMARTCPVETLLSGPSASVIGGMELSGEKDAILLDMGGTTTDIAMIRKGEPIPASKGILIGQYRTSIRGVDAQAVSLGGDTAIRFRDNSLYLDSIRIIPISILASRYESVLEDLRELSIRTSPHTRMIHEFYVLQKDITGKPGYTEEEYRICDQLKDGPVITLKLTQKAGLDLYHMDTSRLEQEGVIIKSGLTPTDIMVWKKDLTLYDDTAVCYLLTYFAMNLDVAAETIPDTVYEMVIRTLYKNIGAYLLSHRYPKSRGYFAPPNTELLLDACYEQARRLKASGQEKNCTEIASLSLTTSLPLIGIGAPVHVFLPEAAELLGTRAILSDYSCVANALGAAASRRIANAQVSVTAVYDGFSLTGYRVTEDCEDHFFENKEEAIACGRQAAITAVRKRALLQGLGSDPDIRVEEQENYVGNTILVRILILARAGDGVSDPADMR